jgi:OmpA-OmpF porin, OOP family
MWVSEHDDGNDLLAATVRISPAFAGSRQRQQKAENLATYESRIKMTNSLTKKQMALAVSCALTLGIVSGTANTQTNRADTGYLTDQRGGVAKSGYGLCWHIGTDTARVSTLECDPNFVPAPIAKAVEPPPKVVEPAPVAVEPPPAPVAVVAPEPAPKPVLTKVTLDADALFDFDKAVLRPAGRASLDNFVARLKEIDPEVIIATGHTDRIGSQIYNQRLSEQRVEAVKAYLVSRGIEPNRTHTEGKGEMQPVTKAGECDGAVTAKLIACLQPDRRVDVEVVGTRIAR